MCVIWGTQLTFNMGMRNFAVKLGLLFGIFKHLYPGPCSQRPGLVGYEFMV